MSLRTPEQSVGLDWVWGCHPFALILKWGPTIRIPNVLLSLLDENVDDHDDDFDFDELHDDDDDDDDFDEL